MRATRWTASRVSRGRHFPRHSGWIRRLMALIIPTFDARRRHNTSRVPLQSIILSSSRHDWTLMSSKEMSGWRSTGRIGNGRQIEPVNRICGFGMHTAVAFNPPGLLDRSTISVTTVWLDRSIPRLAGKRLEDALTVLDVYTATYLFQHFAPNVSWIDVIRFRRDSLPRINAADGNLWRFNRFVSLEAKSRRISHLTR